MSESLYPSRRIRAIKVPYPSRRIRVVKLPCLSRRIRQASREPERAVSDPSLRATESRHCIRVTVSESRIRVTHPSHASESRIRVTTSEPLHPSHCIRVTTSESYVRAASPVRPGTGSPPCPGRRIRVTIASESLLSDPGPSRRAPRDQGTRARRIRVASGRSESLRVAPGRSDFSEPRSG